MTSIAEPTSGTPRRRARPRRRRPSAPADPRRRRPVERELRLDLFRGPGAVADLHRSSAGQPSDLVHDPQLRLQRRHRDLHLHLRLHRGLRLRPRDARPRLRGRDRADPEAGLADLRRPRVPVHDLPGGNFLRRHPFREPALLRRNGHPGFPQAARRHHRPGAAAAVSPGQHGRAAALHRADVLPAADPVADAARGRRHAGAVGRAVCRDLAVRSAI